MRTIEERDQLDEQRPVGHEGSYLPAVDMDALGTSAYPSGSPAPSALGREVHQHPGWDYFLYSEKR